ncbi:hypothetical protein OEZ85_005679 [Tetradesmus obliquus]|uniref:Uncharacterized protein n=1 Tax=Tetradesmus obliquus TaxID=3088 RepID=A0ABY8UEI0_TETOB|nr:hypothetical protein OEZ85_005679 [Tetradesmus obliquus]
MSRSTRSSQVCCSRLQVLDITVQQQQPEQQQQQQQPQQQHKHKHHHHQQQQQHHNQQQHRQQQEHADKPLYPGARVNNMDAVYKLISIWNEHSMTNAAFNDILGFMTELALPQDHTLPKSLYMMKKVLDVAPASKYEWHSCLLGCTGWPPTPQSEWKAHRHDCCGKCGGKRFNIVLGKEVPVRRFWYIRPQESIEELMMDPDFVTAIRTAKAKVVGNFWASPEWERVNEATGGAAAGPGHGVIAGGGDFFQPFKNRQWSTGGIWWRYECLPDGASAWAEWHSLTVLIEGPTEPTVMDAFLQPLTADIVRLAPPQPPGAPAAATGGCAAAAAAAAAAEDDSIASDGAGAPAAGGDGAAGAAAGGGGVAADGAGGHGVYVTPAERDPNTSAILAGTAFLHFAVLGAVYADSPARAKLMYTVASWTAYLVCPFCIMVGTMVDDVVRYLGYAHAVAITKGYGAGKTCSMTGGGDDRYVDEFVNRVRAHAAEQYRAAGVQPPDNSPFKGLSPFLSEDLYWVDANRLWIVPFCHAFFLGVFKDFLEAIFAKGAAAQESKVPQVPNDGNTSEQVLQPDIVKESFGHLRRFGLFHMTHHSFDSEDHMLLAAMEAHEELLAYCKAAEGDLSGGKLCTFNLHLLACQLLMQVASRGLTAPLGELWIERLVGGKKGRSKGGTKSHPEVTMIIDEMVTRALRRARLKYAHLNLQTWQEHVGRDAPLGVARSVLLAEGHLMGAPKPFGAEAWGTVKDLVREKLRINLTQAEWQRWSGRWDEVVVQQYQRAVLPGGTYATSTLYPLSRSRDGTWVMVLYMEGAQVKPYAARVKYYLRLSLPAAAGEQVLRLAMCDFLPYRQPLTGPDICDQVLFSTGSLAEALKSGERATAEQLRKDASKGLLALLPTAEAKAAKQQGTDLEGSKAAAKALMKRKAAAAAAAAAAAPESAAAPAADASAGAAPAKKRKGRKGGKGGKQPPKKKKQSKESEEEAEAGSSSSGEEDEFEAASSGEDDDMVATEAAATAAAAGGRRRRAGAGVNQKFAEYET